jgi:DNA-binding transcriptional LysR family regulator
MNAFETRELEQFVAVARELSFSRAAESLGVAQPAVSRTVTRLERRLGVPLLERSTRHVALTPAGATLLREASRALELLSAAERRTVRAGQRDPRLVVALKPDGDAGLLAPLTSAYAQERFAEPLDLCFVGPSELPRCLHDGRADVAFISAPFDPTGLDVEELVCEPRVVALQAEHPLAGESQLTLDDLASEPVARWPDVPPELAAFYRACDPDCTRSAPAGEEAPEGPNVRDLTEALRMVELGRTITFVPRSVAERFPRDAIAYRDVAGISASRTFVAWPEHARSPAIAAFVRLAVDIAATRGSISLPSH